MAVPFSPSSWARQRATRSTGNGSPGRISTIDAAGTYGTRSCSVTATIGTPDRAATRSAFLSGSPIQTSAATPCASAVSTTADGSPSPRSARAASWTRLDAPATASGRRSPAPTRSSRTSPITASGLSLAFTRAASAAR